MRAPVDCIGTTPRRQFLRMGLLGTAGLTLPDLLRAEEAVRNAESDATTQAIGGEVRPRTLPTGKSIIVLWLWGGPSHMETFDLKPDAPVEYRGEFHPIPTTVPGLEISEYLPELAKLGQHLAILRSLQHDSPGHANSSHTLLTGYPGDLIETPPYKPRYPDVWAVAHRVLGERLAGVPPYVAMPFARYNGAAYLTNQHDPLVIAKTPNDPAFRVPGLTVPANRRQRLLEQATLRQRFDGLDPSLDPSRGMESLDTFQRRAVDVLSSTAVERAFRIDQEHPRLRDRYGRNDLGQRCLLARRMVEAGVRIVTIDFAHVPGQKAFSWDDHASVWNIFTEMRARLPVLDQAASALIRDLEDRGMLNDCMVVLMGEMSHTPRISYHQGNPGREHWGHTMSVLLAGGGLRTGQAVGETTRKGDEVKSRPLRPTDLLATWYQYLGVPLDLAFTDYSGRPIPILPNGEPIQELLG